MVKNLPANAGDTRDAGSIPWLGRSPGVGNGNPLQYSYLEKSHWQRSLQATGHGVAKSQAWLSTHASGVTNNFTQWVSSLCKGTRWPFISLHKNRKQDENHWQVVANKKSGLICWISSYLSSVSKVQSSRQIPTIGYLDEEDALFALEELTVLWMR